MRITFYLAAATALLAATALQPAHSQPARHYRGETVVCESQDGHYNRCRLPWEGGAQIVEQLSSSACVRGQTWGTRGRSVWVDQGCRARFAAVAYGPGPGGWAPPPGWDRRFEVSCGSQDYHYNFCQVDVGRRGRVYLRRQISGSACVEGSTWGWNRAGVWVDRGCEGRFGVDRRW
ncbi:MAG: DUF3011 domain-containing protein [Rhodanobacteraceae bacterium]